MRNSGFLKMIGRRDLKSERTWWCRWQHYASHPVVHHRCSSFHGMLGKHPTLLMYRSMWSKPLADWKFSFWKMNCPLPCLPWLMILFVSAVLCVICSHHPVFNIFVCKYVILFTKCGIWTGAWKNSWVMCDYLLDSPSKLPCICLWNNRRIWYYIKC